MPPHRRVGFNHGTVIRSGVEVVESKFCKVESCRARSHRHNHVSICQRCGSLAIKCFAMNKIAVVLGSGVLALTVGCLEQLGGSRTYKGPLLKYHYVGRAHLPDGTNAARFKEIEALPATAELRTQIAQKLAGAVHRFWQKDLPSGAPDQSALLQPLLEDFLAGEAFVEVRGAVGRTDTVLAIELSDQRAQLWEKNLRQIVTGWKLGSIQDLMSEGFKGWEVKKTQAPNSLQFVRAGKWIVLGLGQDRPAQISTLLAEAKRSGRPVPLPKDSFLDLSADLPGLRAWFPLLAQWPLPPITASLSGRGEYVRTEVKLQYSGKIPLTLEPWKIPTNIISEPLTSFTVGRGIAPLLNQVKGLPEVGLNPLPNQFCAWGINHEQCRMFFTVPVANPTNAIRQIAPRFPGFFQSFFSHPQGEFLYASNRAELLLGSVPFIVPMLRPEKNGSDQFIFGTIFPPAPKPTPVPDEVFAQVRGRTNLVYYDWEITEQRLHHGLQFYQLSSIIDRRPPPGTNSPSKRWLSAIGPKLINSVTEISHNSPQELTLVRRSHVGFTGFELSTLSTWLDSPGFPYKFELPPPLSARLGTNAAGRTNSPNLKTNPLPTRAVPPPSRKP